MQLTSVPYLKYRAQRGVVLPLALFLLVVMTIIGIMVISNSTQSDKSIQSLRSNAIAQQGAEIGLRYCENVVMTNVDDASKASSQEKSDFTKVYATSIATQDDTTAIWRTKANWAAGAANRIDIPSAAYQKSTSGDIKIAPACIIQKLGSNSYLITARGFGNDAQVTDTTKKDTVKTGAEVWLQSVITPES